MQLRRLCIILPADADEADPSPSDRHQPCTHKLEPDHVQPTEEGGKVDVHHLAGRASAFLRRSLHLFCRQVRCLGFGACCVPRHGWLDHGEDPSGTEFHDISGLCDAAGRHDGAAADANPKIFSYAELYIGTGGFSEKEVLGSGGYGRVYRAVLPSDGTVVAVKCVAADRAHQFEKTFAAELVAVAQLRHRNLVRLRGWCVHERQLLLVYDYMPNGSLDRLLFAPAAGGQESAPTLGWERRRRVVAGLAAALFYLHEQLDAQIIHRDVKSSNVMLDSGYGARLGDFGLARWLEHDGDKLGAASMRSTSSASTNYGHFRLTDTSKIGGTIGYLPPESFQLRQRSAVTAKSDVFSFGIVVLEVVSGRRAVDLSYPDDKIILLDWVRRLSDEGRYLQAGDSRLPDGSYSLSEMRWLVHLALLCTLHEPNSRPTMKWVQEALSSAGSGAQLPALPSFQSHPQYISLSSSSTDTSAASSAGTSSTSTFPHYVTASNSTVFLTAGGDDDSSSGSGGGRSCGSESSAVDENMNAGRRQGLLLSASFPMVDTPREISFKEIVALTNDFSEAQMVAEMDFGTGYQGFLENRFHVLVKRLGMKTCPALRLRFADELRNLGRLRHRHLVQLRGWCTEQGEMLVVYDYSSSGLLSHHLFHNRGPVLPWRHRYSIVKALASAVLYLHEEWDEQVIHRSVTSSAVFLDPDKNPRLGCFALAEFLTRNSHGGHHVTVTTPSVRGIFGYMAPEYVQSGEATTKADVYSFGIVVLEVVSGQRAVDFRHPEALLVSKVRRFVVRKRPLEELVDRRMGEEYDGRELARLVQLGFLCTHSDPESRPSMRQIVSILDGNDALLKSLGWKKEGMGEWQGRNASSLSLVRRIHALGIH